MLSYIHHINFLVKDLDEAVQRYENILGLGPAEFGDLAQRAVRTARFKIGQSWLVLVQPIDDQSIPARHLEEHGEGFFLLSLGSDNLAQELDDLERAGAIIDKSASREGLDGWRINDLDIGQFFGAQIQLCEDKNQIE